MNNTFYLKLARTNIKNNKTTYVPYILSCIICIVMFYNMHTLTLERSLQNVPHSGDLAIMFKLGTGIVRIFSAIFLFYTNSFLIKRRKKELGLYNILGLEKRHISMVLAIETIMVMLFVLVSGIGTGVLFNKVIFMVLFRLLKFKVTVPFVIESASVLATVYLFALIFALTLVYNLLQVHIAKPIELLKGGQTGEKEPKASIPIFLLGLATMGTGYYLALTITDPLAALTRFFLAVILVIIGTYCLFVSGSIFLLKKLKNNEKIYYRPKSFVTISGMIYRMKQNAAGLASICVLSSMVIVTLSTTFALYISQEDMLQYSYPTDISISGFVNDTEQITKTNDHLLKKYNLTASKMKAYDYGIQLATSSQNDILQPGSATTKDSLKALVIIYSIDDYNKLTGEHILLSPNQALVYTTNGTLGDSLQIGTHTLAIQKQLPDFPIDSDRFITIPKEYYIVVNQMSEYLNFFDNPNYTHSISYDIAGDKDSINAFVDELIDQYGDVANVTHRDSYRLKWYMTYGSFLFLGIFIGILFLMATTLIIYYKQISEGYDDAERFQIMQKVGMSQLEVKQTINAQILTIFFIPLLTAFVHTTIAFPMISELLKLFGLMNTSLIALGTVTIAVAFMLIYIIIYRLTAKPYYKLVGR